MSRNLKALGLALFAVFAMSAMAASAAQAVPQVTAAKYPVTVHGTGGSPGEVFKVGTAEFKCEVSHFHGQQTLVEHEANPSTVTITPTYTDSFDAGAGKNEPTCTAIGAPVTVTMNGCDYLFHTYEKEAADAYWAEVDIVCPPSALNGIEVHIYTDKTETKSLCTVTIPAQNGLKKVTIKDDTTAPEDVTVSGTVGGIHAIIHRNSILCPKLPEQAPGTEVNTTTKAAEYIITTPITLTGKDPSSATSIGISVSGA